MSQSLTEPIGSSGPAGVNGTSGLVGLPSGLIDPACPEGPTCPSDSGGSDGNVTYSASLPNSAGTEGEIRYCLGNIFMYTTKLVIKTILAQLVLLVRKVKDLLYFTIH